MFTAKSFVRFSILGFLCALAIALPSLAGAFDFDKYFASRPSNIHERIMSQLRAALERSCDIMGTPNGSNATPLFLPSFCPPPEPPPPPPPTDVCPNVPGDQASGPCADVECAENGGTWNGNSCDMPPPPPADACPNVPGDQASGPCADTECVENGGTWNDESCDMPTIGHVVISEVFYDVDTGHGTNTGNGNNEWVELYNGSAETINLSGWKIADNGGSDTLPEGTLLPAEGLLIITATTSTAGFWDIPEGAEVIVLGSTVGGTGGLAAGGDVVFLRDEGDVEIDAVSWGTNTDAFAPSVPGVVKGHSIARTSLTVDTDSAADWEDRDVPSPGMADVPLPFWTVQ